MNVRHFLSIGMFLSGIFSFLFGLAYWANIHAYGYFIAVQVNPIYYKLYKLLKYSNLNV